MRPVGPAMSVGLSLSPRHNPPPCRSDTETPRPRTASTRRSSGSRAHEYGDLLYEKGDGIAKISINRPEVRNAFRPQTLAELRDAFNRARDDTEVGSIIFTGAGDEAFCSGGDQRIRGDDGYIGDDEVAAEGRRPAGRRRPARADPPLPKPVVAMVAGLRGRRRPHPAPRLRPDDRRRERPLRADRPAGRQLRRRLRRLAARQQHRRQARQGDLVPLPPLRRGRGARRWGWSTRSCRSASSSARRSPGAAR